MPTEQATTEVSLSAPERKLIKELTSPGAKITALIPDNADASELWRDLETCIKAIRMVNDTHAKLLPVIGRALSVFKENPSLFQDHGYESWEDFLKRGVQEKLGLTHTDCTDSLRLMRNFPDLDIQTYVSVGRRNFQILSKFTNHKDPAHKRYIEKAKAMSSEELIRWAEKKGLIEQGEATTVTLTVVTSLDVYRDISRYLSDPLVQAYNQTSDKGQIIRYALVEAAEEWKRQGEHGQHRDGQAG